MQRHGNGIAGRLAQGGCSYLDDPECESDCRNLARMIVNDLLHPHLASA
jgi:hypothetical protein